MRDERRPAAPGPKEAPDPGAPETEVSLRSGSPDGEQADGDGAGGFATSSATPRDDETFITPQGRLAVAIVDLCWRATPFGQNSDGDIEDYLLTAGTVHRLIGAAQGVGIHAAFRVPRGDTNNTTKEKS